MICQQSSLEGSSLARPAEREAAVSETTSGYALPIGTLEDARAMIGQRTAPRLAEAEVSWGQVKSFCAMTHDGNPSYWEPEFATAQWGGLVAPPAMLMTWLMPLEWSPQSSTPQPMLPARVPLPGPSMINGSNDTTYFLPVMVGDRLTVEEEVVSVSDEKTTRLGVGHFVETLSVYRNQRSEVVAEVRNTLFRFTPVGAS
jgi:acyl dehydratase